MGSRLKNQQRREKQLNSDFSSNIQRTKFYLGVIHSNSKTKWKTRKTIKQISSVNANGLFALKMRMKGIEKIEKKSEQKNEKKKKHYQYFQ